MTRRILIISALVAFSARWIEAAPEATAEVSLRLLAFSPQIQVADMFIHDPAEPKREPVTAAIKTYLNDQLVLVALSGRKVAFTMKKDPVSLTSEVDLLGEVTLPNGAKSAVCLFLPGKPGGTARYQVVAVDDSKDVFPAGSLHVTNMCPVPVQLRLENKPFDFMPGQLQVIKDPPVREGQRTGVRTIALKNDKWQQVSSGMWTHPGKGRKLMVVFSNENNGHVEIRAFDDVPPSDKPAANP